MTKIISYLMIVALLMSSVLAIIPINAEEGGETEPYVPAGSPISSAAELAAMTNNNSYYLTANITLDANWTPISGLTGVTLDGKDTNGTVHSINFAGGTSIFTGASTDMTIKNINFTGAITVADTSATRWGIV